jgi:hypothetical protein
MDSDEYIYGAAQDENRESFLSELASMCANNNGPLHIGGISIS